MTKGYKVFSSYKYAGSNCIIVTNYKKANDVVNWFYNESDIDIYKQKNDVGVWKIKQLK